MISALARSTSSKRLLEFAESHDLLPSWDDPAARGVTAFITGRDLDNMTGDAELVDGTSSRELLLHLDAEDGSSAVVNVNTLLALATAYIRDQHRLAAK